MRTRINLLPTSYRRKQILRRRTVQWGSLICIGLFGGWAGHSFEMREDRILAQQLDVLERENGPTQRLIQQLTAMRAKLDQLQQQEVVASELERQRGALTLLGVVSNAARQADGRLRITRLEVTNFQRVSLGAATAADSVPVMLLSGESLDNPTVSELVVGLQDSGIFSRVELSDLKERQEPNMPLRDYEVRCEF